MRSSGEQPCEGGQTFVNTIHDYHAQEKTVQEIAQELHISRTTVRKYLKHPEAVIRTPWPPGSQALSVQRADQEVGHGRPLYQL